MAVGVTVLSYVAALAFTVLFEIPYCTISSEILKLKKKPSSSATKLASNENGTSFVKESAEPTLLRNGDTKKID